MRRRRTLSPGTPERRSFAAEMLREIAKDDGAIRLSDIRATADHLVDEILPPVGGKPERRDGARPVARRGTHGDHRGAALALGQGLCGGDCRNKTGEQ